MATKTYYETPGTVDELNGSDILVVQQGTGTAATGGFAEMKKTTLEDMRGFMVGGIDEEVSQLTSALTDLSEDTYRKAEVDEKVADATPSDYEALKREVREQNYRIDNLETVGDHNTYVEPTSGGVKEMPASVPVAPYAEVMEVRGKTEAYAIKDMGTISFAEWESTHVFYATTINGEMGGRVSGSTLLRNSMYGYEPRTASSSDWLNLSDRKITSNNSNAGFYFRDDRYHASDLVGGKAPWLSGVMLEYDSLTLNTLHDAEVTGVRSVGRNLWDETWESGSINVSTGLNTSNTNYIRSTGFIPWS